MSIHTAFNSEQTAFPIDERLLTLLDNCVQQAAKLEQVQVGEVSVTLVDDVTIQHLNRQYRHIDRPTDVLSFPMEDGKEDGMLHADEVIPLLGDIIVSVPRAVAQAEEYGHSLERELGFLVTHGFLHLLGYDHDNEQAESDMIKMQEAVLSAIGLTR